MSTDPRLRDFFMSSGRAFRQLHEVLVVREECDVTMVENVINRMENA